MIDYIELSIEGNFPPIGKSVRVKQRSGVTSKSYTKDKYRLHDNGPDFDLQVCNNGDVLWLGFSPPKILQGHNAFGSNDVRGSIKYAVLIICAYMGIGVDSDLQRKLMVGDYELHEVHVAELHRMPHCLINELCKAIRRYAPDELHAVPLERGTGIRLWSNSRDRRVLLYDKHAYFMDKPLKHRGILASGLSDSGRTWTFFTFESLLEFVLQGIRIECRFQSAFLKRNKLVHGAAWSCEVARSEYLKMLSTIPLHDLPSIVEAEELISKFSGVAKSLVAHWLDDRDPKQFAPRATYYRHRSAIKKEFGIDISRPAVHLPAAISWLDLIKAESIISLPSCASDSSMYFDPSDPVFSDRHCIAAGGNSRVIKK